MSKFILTVTLNPAIDKTVFVSGFASGKDFRETSLFMSAGGKGINVSRVLGRLGQPAIATGFLGGSNGAYIKDKLFREKIRQDFLAIQGQTRISLTVINPDTSVITRVLERGPVVSRKEIKLFCLKFKKLLSSCKCVILSGRNIPGVPDEFYAHLITLAKKNGIFTLLDTSGQAYLSGLKACPDMIKPNLKEAEYVLKTKLISDKSIKKALLKFRAKGIGIVALTMGSKGAFIYNGKQMFRGKSAVLKRKSPVGCGDAFNAGFMSSYFNKQPLDMCLRQAISCGSANALSINPGFIKRRDIKQIHDKVKIHKVI